MTCLPPISEGQLEAPLTYLVPCRNTHLFYHIWTWKVLQNMGIVFPCHLLPWWGLMEISMNFHGLGGYLCCWGLFVHDTALILPYLEIWRSRPISWLKERATDLSEGQGHIPYMGGHVCLKVKVGHLTTLSQSLLLFHFDLEIGGVTPNLCWMVWPYIFLQNLFQKLMEKCLKSSWKTLSSMGTESIVYGVEGRWYGSITMWYEMPCACVCCLWMCEINAVSNVIQWFLSVSNTNHMAFLICLSPNPLLTRCR